MNKSKLILSVFVFFTVFGTSCMKTVYVNVLKPGQITLPSNIQRVALVNRAVPQSKVLNVLEGLLTGEGIAQDKHGRENVLNGLNDLLRNSPRLSVMLTPEELKSTKTSNGFPAAFTREEVAQLCEKYQCDAIAVMEYYDSDCVPGAVKTKQETYTENGQQKKRTVYYVQQTANVKTGFRLYGKDGGIIDQNPFQHYISWQTSGSTAATAIASQSSRVQYMNRCSYQAGELYARRISPTWTNVARRYYKRGKNNHMKMGGRYARSHDWANAETEWKAAVAASTGKQQGKAYYNLALVAEINGDLEEAKRLCADAYAKYNIKKARNYSVIINQRIREAQVVEQQMK